MDTAAFNRLLDVLRTATPRDEITLEEVPAPQKLATFSFAFTADVTNGLVGDEQEDIATGRFVLLHEPGGQDTWDGEFRCVTFVSADVDAAMQEDPLLPEVGWNWLLASLEKSGSAYNSPSGTVTRVSSASFGKLSPRNNESEIEIRASWTPVISSRADIGQTLLNHVMSWCNLIAEISFLPPLIDGVSSIQSPRR